ncbi:MAG TPA: universal stress protein [Hyphomicrobiaceae bacterium]|jgi:nucleotide-binding universal stress UspA family protein|nr:universal stress protein [Hyphomicrobiaceae bacterium]
MKSILLPVDQSEQMPSALETARLLGNLFGSTIEGVALRPAFAEIVAPDPIVAVTIPPADWSETEFCRSVRQTFDAYAAQFPPSGGGARFRWRGGSAIDDGTLGSLGRVYDATVLSRPGNHGSRMTALEAALFDSGSPVLMAPPVAPKSFGQTVLIHWNASTETARAILMAMPILRKANRVQLLAVEGSVVAGPSTKDAIGHLEANGISASEKTISGRGQRPGEAILAEAAAIGADLLIKGAYTQSRLRQMIFGGATSHILSAAELPVFLAH